ncbi:MAG: DUF1284 domain-containing protein [Bacteriovoracia bacterium]
MLKFRPHHFFCALGFQGKGYSEVFTRNFQDIVDRLRERPQGDAIEIEVEAATDSICEPCPNRRGRLCETEEKIQTLDRGHAEVLGVRPGETYTWREAKRRLAERMTFEAHERVCAPCGWKKLGYCKTALTNVKKEFSVTSLKSWTAVVGLAGSLMLAGGYLEAHASPSNRKAASKPAKGAETVAPTKLSVELDLSTPQFVDQVLDAIGKNRRHKSARRLAAAFKALAKKKYGTVREQVQDLTADPWFADYAHFLEASIHLGEAQAALASRGKKGKTEAKSPSGLARAAMESASRIALANATSPLLDRVPELVAGAELVLAQAAVGAKDWNGSLRQFESAFSRIPTKRFMVKVPFPAVLAYFQVCKKKEASLCSAWVPKIAQIYPHASREFKELAKLSPEITQLPKAPYYGRKFVDYKSGDKDRLAFDEAMGAYLEGDASDALDKFQQFLADFPQSQMKFRALFWVGKIFEGKGRGEDAKKAYQSVIEGSPLSYYGILASYASGIRLESYIDASLPKVQPRAPFLEAKELQALDRAEMFFAENAHEAASTEMQQLSARSALPAPYLMYLVAQNDAQMNYLQSFRIIGELLQRGSRELVSTYGLRSIFPLAYRDVIQKQALDARLDPLLVLSLIKQESAFEADAISSSGALGLMQLMPFTAVETDDTVFQTEVVQPEVNVRVGCKYFASLLSQFKGNIALSLAGYNAGPHRAKKWLQAAKPKWGLLEFVESIPFTETREYVASIIRNYFWYSYRLNGVRLESLDYFWGMSGPFPTSNDLPKTDTSYL